MAKQKSVLKVEGTLDDLTFYKSGDGYLVKTKSAISKSRIQNDPSFARTRENDAEFGSAAHSGKLLRDTSRTMMKSASDGRVTSRLTRILMLILKMDTTSARGEHNVGIGITLPTAMVLLKGFEFNIRSQIKSVLFKPYSVDTISGKISINNLVPKTDVGHPEGATHLSLSGAFENVDFATGVNAIEYSNVVTLPIDSAATTVTLSPAGVPAGAGTKIYLLKIEFFQQVNGVLYELNNGAFNALVIAELAP
ncbi:MAG: hypothetical protein ABI723_24605 [Bacteroidia bacterium]